MKRVLTALVLIPVVTWVVLWANLWIFLAVLCTVACLCYREFDDIAGGYGFGKPGVVGYGAGLCLLIWWNAGWIIVVALALFAMTLAMRTRDLSHSLPRAAFLLLGVVYVFGCWKCARPLREINPHWLMYGLALTWIGDMGAYYIGKPFGRHKLAPRISPGKSWEGAVASMFFSVAFGASYVMYFIPGVGLAAAIGLTAAANIAGQIGDLAESAMKRGANLKDSGGILPGHGGFLDRVDSTLFALPVIYVCLLAAR
ncbi:MAG TPA: phosphatidate cytidylyltransferase [Candidatus Acidoferrales bacterium]|nr:phosphatidate cytidylyltransferase [Candidatus Acidoferrales bacterium]